MDAETTKTILEIVSEILDIVGLVIIAFTAFLFWLMSAVPKARITAICWFPDSREDDTPFPISAQIHFFNPAVGSFVVTEIEINRLLLEQRGEEISRLSPYAFLEPLLITDKHTAFSANTREFASEFLLKGHDEETKHIGFHLDSKQNLEPESGELTIKLEVLYTSYGPVRKLFRMIGIMQDSPKRLQYIYSKDLSCRETKIIRSKEKTLFLPRGLPRKRSLQYIGMKSAKD